MISVSSTDSITKYGYRLFPDTYSTAAYTFLWNERGTIFNSLIISVVVTVMGTVLGVLLTGTADPEVMVPQMMQELRAAGFDKIVAEAQSQVDAFMATNK